MEGGFVSFINEISMASKVVELLLSGMVKGEVELVRQSLSPKVVLRSPILEDPVEGPDAVVGVIGALRGFIDTFELLGIMEGDGLHTLVPLRVG